MSASAAEPPVERTGLLLVNLGTPEAPTEEAVRAYLREFLSDPLVLDMAAWQRWLLLNLIILPRRPRVSAEAYAKIWTERGSPLLFHGRDLVAAVQSRFGPGVAVDLAMRYGSPSIAGAVERMRAAGIRRITAFPLYPQYSAAATRSSIEALKAAAATGPGVPIELTIVPPFYAHPAYIEACTRQAAPVLEALRPEKVLFSFHGLPERQVRKEDASGAHCLVRGDCCDAIGEVNSNCYRAQAFATARLIGDRLGIDGERRIICFQSRLGRTAWIRPYTAETIDDLARQGVRRIAVLSPAFVADCLETLEEIGLRAATSFRKNGGEVLDLVPSLNATPSWVDAVVTIAREASPAIRMSGPGHAPSRTSGAPHPGGSTAGTASAEADLQSARKEQAVMTADAGNAGSWHATPAQGPSSGAAR